MNKADNTGTHPEVRTFLVYLLCKTIKIHIGKRTK